MFFCRGLIPLMKGNYPIEKFSPSQIVIEQGKLYSLMNYITPFAGLIMDMCQVLSNFSNIILYFTSVPVFIITDDMISLIVVLY